MRRWADFAIRPLFCIVKFAMKVEPVVLEGSYVRLEPLGNGHVDALARFAYDESLWKWTPSAVRDRESLERYVQAALREKDAGTSLPFVTVEKTGGVVVGCTRFGNIDIPNRKVEIGWTWVDPAWQRTRVNTEAKLMMLTHAFNVWKCIRVELKTDALNARSRHAILRLGAKEEGTLQNHMIADSGRFRDSVYYSIIETEWNAVKEGLIDRLG